MIDFLTNEYRTVSWERGKYPQVELDMGCGRGGFTRQLAQRYPERLILASDVMKGRLEIVERKLQRANCTNFRLLRAESGMLAEFQLPLQSIDRIHLLCPDPWPKELPRKGRRLASTAFFCLLPRLLKPRGIFHFSSDNVPYFDDAQAVLDSLPFFQRAPEAIADIGDLKTDFEMLWEAEGTPVRHAAYRLQMPEA